MSQRIRYSRVENNKPKNTLLTQQEGETVYFGIARCNLDADTFHRNYGKYIAGKRLGAIKSREDISTEVGNVEVAANYMRGMVNVKHVRELLKFFENIDSFMFQQAAEGQRND